MDQDARSGRRYPASLIWCIRKSGRELRDRVEEQLAWQRVMKEINDGTIGGEFETSELNGVAAKVRTAETESREEVWASYRFIAFADPKAEDGLREIDLGAGHSSGAKSLCDRVIGALKSNTLLNDSPGAGYLERRWPQAFKETGAWPLRSLRQALLDGSLERVINPDEYLKRKVPEFVSNGDFGLASGDQPGGGFERVWFRQPISPDEVSFDTGVYLLRRERAEALRSPKPPTAETDTGTEPTAGTDSTRTESEASTDHVGVSKGEATRLLTLSGTIPAELWNRVGTRIIPKLRSTKGEPHLVVSFSLEISAAEAASLLRELEQILADLGLAGRIKPELK